MVSNDATFDCILMDLEMPVMSGIAAASEIRKQEVARDIHRRIPIIAVTGNARTEYVEKSISPALLQRLNLSIFNWI